MLSSHLFCLPFLLAPFTVHCRTVMRILRCGHNMVAGLCHFVFSPQNNATRKDEKMKSPTRKDDKLTFLNSVFSCGVFSSFRVRISIFREAGFVISSFRMALFRLFAWRYFVISSFHVASFRRFVFSRDVISGRNGPNQPP